jgi:hypothetical protein
MLLGRTVQNARGLPETVYLQEGSEEELEARRALARELGSSKPLDLGLRFILAHMVDPDRDELDRVICFKNRRSGHPSTNPEADKMIAEYIAARVQDGDQMKRAMSLATERFGLERTQLYEIWRVWKPILERHR